MINHRQHASHMAALTIGLAVLFGPSAVHGAEVPQVTAEELTIEGDNAVYRQNENSIEYSGNVVAFMDGMRIAGDKVLVQMQANQITRITTTGEPASFWQGVTEDQATTRASANTIVYLPGAAALELEGAASLQQAGNTVNSTTIRYRLDLEQIVASGSANERVRMQLVVPASGDGEATP